MITNINGKPAPWSPRITQLWHTFADRADPRFFLDRVTESNYFSPRPYQDQYSTGSREEGFTYTMRGEDGYQHVYQTVIRRHSKVGGDISICRTCGAEVAGGPPMGCTRPDACPDCGSFPWGRG